MSDVSPLLRTARPFRRCAPPRGCRSSRCCICCRISRSAASASCWASASRMRRCGSITFEQFFRMAKRIQPVGVQGGNELLVQRDEERDCSCFRRSSHGTSRRAGPMRFALASSGGSAAACAVWLDDLPQLLDPLVRDVTRSLPGYERLKRLTHHVDIAQGKDIALKPALASSLLGWHALMNAPLPWTIVT